MGYHEIALEVSGEDLEKLDKENGGHKLQRVSPTERRGRIHSSTVTVSVIDPNVKTSDIYQRRKDSDFEISWFGGTGPGGQHKNKHFCCCRLTHIPSGLVEIRQGRSRESNLREAKQALLEKLDKAAHGEISSIVSEKQRSLVGSGMRGDKTVTIRFQDDRVHHHGTDKTMTATKYMKGFMDQIW